MGDITDFVVGQIIELSDGRTATVRYAGNTQFAAGDWLGVELDDNSGKNDGAVQGQRYFDCTAGHGMFIRPSVATIIDRPIPKPAKRMSTAPNGAAVKGRQTSTSNAGVTSKRQSIIDPIAKRKSINAASPTPSMRSQTNVRALRSPTKSPTKQLAPATASARAGVSRMGPPPPTTKPPLTAAAKRTSITGRQSLAPSTATSASTRPAATSGLTTASRPPPTTRKLPAGRLSTLQQPTRGVPNNDRRQDSRDSRDTTTEDQEIDAPSPASDEQAEADRPSQSSPHTSMASRPSKTIADGDSQPRARPTTHRISISNGAALREIEDLKTKIKVTERQRMEDREKVKHLEQVQAERNKFESIIQKLQAKYQPQQQEIAELRKQVKEAEAKLEASENQQVDIDTAVEMATLDREMAEEQAEAYKVELETLRAKCEELELEAEILREENSELGKEMSPEERTSQGWVQMERNNERLREALMRLRDMSQDQEAELREQIEELRNDTADLDKLREKYEEASNKLGQSEQTVEDLRSQLDSALGAEEMIEELTDKNMSLTERIDELRIVIEELESLKELNDELELNHVENGKQLQDEVDYHEAMYLDQVRKTNVQEETIVDLEYTISRFRELVLNLQSDLEDMRASQQINEDEAAQLSDKSKKMMDLNLRLQASASKTQNKTIEMEIGKLEAQEAADHLAIVRCFLPESYSIDKDSVNAYLRIKRIGFKSRLLHGFIKERASGVAVQGHEADVFSACVVLDGLVWVSEMCQRFSKFVSVCSLDSFKKLEGALYDLDPVERTLNSWIENLKRDELREERCAPELQRSIALMSHLSEVHLPDNLQQNAEDIHMRAIVMQSRLDNSAVAVAQMKSISQAKIILPTDADEEDEAAAERFIENADLLTSQLRSVKVIAGKAIYQLAELRSRSLTLDPSSHPMVEQTESVVVDLASTCQSSAESLLKLINEEGRVESITYDEVTRAIAPQDSSPFAQLFSQAQVILGQMQNLHNLTTTISQTVEFSVPTSPAPWVALSENLKAEASASALHEKEVLRLKDELLEKNTTVAMKDKSIEELNVSVEVLSKRVNEAGSRKERLRELEVTVETNKAKELESANKIHGLERELQVLEAERENWVKQAANTSGTTPSNGAGGLSSPVVSAEAIAELDTIKMELDRTRSAIRHLHQSSLRKDPAPTQAWLSEPLVSKPSWNQTRVGLESQDVYKSMLSIAVSADFKMTRLEGRARGERLSWRSASNTASWKVGRQREQWEAWRDWQHSAGKLQHEKQYTDKRKAERAAEREAVAKIEVNLGGRWPKGGLREVKIVDSEEWSEAERELGVV